MKRLLSIVLALGLIAMAFAGCGGNDDTENENDNTTAAIKTGLGVVTTVKSSTPPEENVDGIAQTDSVVAAVIIGTDGKISKCKIDGTQTQIKFGNDGKLITSKETVFKSKNDLGSDYGLAETSGIGKEWNEQAAAFAEYCQGKTLDEVKGIAVDDNGVPTGTDLTSSVTIQVGDFITAVEKAVNTAKELGNGAEDKLGLAVETTIANSADAASDKEGLAEAYTDYIAVTIGEGDKITGTLIDSTQADVSFDTSGKITTDLNAEVKSKQELGEDYGLKEASGIGKEWFEQVDSFASLIKGLTAAEVKDIKVTSDGVPEDTDISTSVTISVTEYINLIERAATSAN